MKRIRREEQHAVRLTANEIDNIKTSVLSIDPHAKVYLFGSRTNVMKRGGDIDILIVSGSIGRRDVSKIRWHFYEQFGEQKMDIVVDDGSSQSPFVKMIFSKAVLL